MSLPPRPSQSSPAGEPTFVRQLRQWGAGIHDNLAQLQPGFRGQQFPSGSVPFRPPLMWPPHKAVQYDDLVVQVGPSRAMGVRAPDELVIISYRGALITVTLSTVENVTVTGSGYIYYEVTCTAGVWDAEAKYIAALSSLTAEGIIYVPIAKITVTSSVISRIEQLLHDNPTVQIGSPQYSITVDPQNGRLQLDGDVDFPGPFMVYGTNGDGERGWIPYSDLCAYCSGVPPEDLPPCGTCEDLPACLDFGAYVPDDCGDGCVASGFGATAWDGKIYLVPGQCKYLSKNTTGGVAVLINGCVHTITMERYYDSEADPVVCYWRLVILRAGSAELVWVGTTADGDEQGTFTRQAGCDTTATLALTLCLRTIRLTISGMVRCCSSSAYKPDSVAMLNGTWDIVEDSPGAGTWTLAFGAFESWNLDTYDGAACTGNITGSVAQDLNVQVTYDEVTTWHINGANDGFGSSFWIFGTDTGGDETGGTCVGIYACGDVGDTILAAGGTATIEVL
jgi:hypothetical protein